MTPNLQRSDNGKERNTDSPYYDACLDDAVDEKWRGWSCSKCEKSNVRARPDDQIDGYFLFFGEAFRQEEREGPRHYRRQVI
jgi:hypothetical protein